MLDFTANEHKIISEVKSLIDTKIEGDYWDFKAEAHNNKAELLHDIICMANSLHRGNKYIILGVNNRGEICGIQDNANRKNQQNYIDFIQNSNKRFAGGHRPSLRVVTFQNDSKTIDVIVVGDSTNVPFYLEDDYQCQSKIVKKHHIYTRIGDTNTAIDSSADFPIAENLWKKRFGLDIKNEIRDSFLAPLIAHIDLLENYYIQENQEFVFNINKNNSIVAIDDNYNPIYFSIDVNFSNFEMSILKECIKYYESIAISSDEKKDKTILHGHIMKREMFCDSIFQRYLPESQLYNEIKQINEVCIDFLSKSNDFMLAYIFTPTELTVIQTFQCRCYYYINNINSRMSQDEVVLQYPQLIRALIKMKETLKII